MTRMQPGAGQQEVASKRKRSEVQVLSEKAAKMARRREREAKKMVRLLDVLEAERRRMQQRTTYACEHAAVGCGRRFLSPAGASKHSKGTDTLLGCRWGPRAQLVQPVTLARVHVRVRPNRLPPPCHRHVISSAIDPPT
eukprot:2182386-Prymnesium_polylepis.1